MQHQQIRVIQPLHDRDFSRDGSFVRVVVQLHDFRGPNFLSRKLLRSVHVTEGAATQFLQEVVARQNVNVTMNLRIISEVMDLDKLLDGNVRCSW